MEGKAGIIILISQIRKVGLRGAKKGTWFKLYSPEKKQDKSLDILTLSPTIVQLCQ